MVYLENYYTPLAESESDIVKETRRLKKINEEKIARIRGQEKNKEKQDLDSDLALFLQFLEKNKQEIEERVVAGENLEDILYEEFYNCDKNNLRYADGDPKTERIKREYQASFLKIEKEIKMQIKEAHSNGDYASLRIKNGQENYWFQVQTNGGLNVREDTIGRFYFNCDVERAPDFFKKLSDACVKAGIRVEIKMPRREDSHALNRFDKMLLYFNADEENKILKIVEEMHAQNEDIFKDKNTPRFTGKVKSAQGDVMQGVSFGEEPVAYDESFGNIRVKILAELVSEAQKNGYSIFNPKFDITNAFQKLCEKHGVDHNNPAYNNVRKKGKDFAEIRKRCQ
jgi:hypothetical protein